MTNQSKDILMRDYDVKEEIISCVPHGTHIVIYEEPKHAKAKFNFEDKIVLSTFGLLGEGKNIETGLQALAKLSKRTKRIVLNHWQNTSKFN